MINKQEATQKLVESFQYEMELAQKLHKKGNREASENARHHALGIFSTAEIFGITSIEFLSVLNAHKKSLKEGR